MRFKYALRFASATDRITTAVMIGIGALVAATTAHQWEYLWEGES